MKKDELMHYGILGMKWGHRKAKAPNSEDYTRYRELRKKKVSQLSTRELNELNSRMQAEDNYKRNKNNRDPLNRAYKMAVGVGLAITALETTHKALQRVKKGAKPIAVNVYDRIKKLKHSDMDNDYLMHYGVLGMKWRNHIYKKKLNKLNKNYKESYKTNNDIRKGIIEGNKIKNNTKNKSELTEKIKDSNKKINKEAAKLIAKRIGLAAGIVGGAYLAGKGIERLADNKNNKYAENYLKNHGINPKKAGEFDWYRAFTNSPDVKESRYYKPILFGTGAAIGLGGKILKQNITKKAISKNAKNVGYNVGLKSNSKDYKANIKDIDSNLKQLEKEYKESKEKLDKKYKNKNK